MELAGNNGISVEIKEQIITQEIIIDVTAKSNK